MKYSYNRSYNEDCINVWDTVNATVTDNNCSGVYLLLDTGEKAFSYHSRMARGTRVTCSVKRLANEKHDIVVTIDSACADLLCA